MRWSLRRILWWSFLWSVVVIGSSCSGGDEADDDVEPTPGDASVILTEDGERLSFDRTGSGSRAVVLAHQRGSDRLSWTGVATALAEAGYSVYAADFRGYGDASGTRDQHLDTDLRAVVARAQEDGAEDVVLIGASMGGTAAVAVAANVEVAGVVTLSGPSTFAGIDALGAAASLSVPTLFFVAEDDQPYADQISAQATAAGDEPQVYAGNAHGISLLNQQPEILVQILGFLANV